MSERPPRPPDGLGPAGRRLWRRLRAADLHWTADLLAILEHACFVEDTIAAIVSALAGEPLTVEGSRGQPAAHPLLAELRLQRHLAGSLLGRLRLPGPASDEDTGLPGEWDGLSASSRARRAASIRWGT